MALKNPERQAASLSEEPFSWEAPGPRAKRTELGPPYLRFSWQIHGSEEGAGGTWIYKVRRIPRINQASSP
ncbi:hypothetical protein H112_01500 [Trichophyton rubrum D6]|uniref:Uncharacterized protein n=2 Tax=Trichophyton TaxID=5550 RepID=A0A022WD60_TRIRU|nr:hypothetical protein H100_01495 [Trichophyton rubrum MR850]EZF45316.1 hypothetical protein H102_01491 [Trichophyton rubrum CBS 100081]EZF56066.1 hypothetical protein H103_01504 [Trichophyton rubrum CBS 288.86]EZF66564.1 hypothetical protein H104_01480 [Trichophyton rubrum CBS 289.86]EZF77173.1 hypothetical protein H105_01507 [Trichophyton soudanense CBS 452.61]EZF87863.1 hypothetical protein H110_01500 [Trichophyton rubrum MR1448]EZF98646.1 hypothetical protein H113_01504 [Trichophyton rub